MNIKLQSILFLLMLLSQVLAETSISTNNRKTDERHVVALRNKHHHGKINCKVACARRCKKSSRKNVCHRACGTCCKKCDCVPPGTYGNKDACPCYAHLKTHGNKPKCP